MKFLKKVVHIVRKRWYIAAIVILIGVFVGWRFINGSDKDKPKNPYTVKRQTIKETLTFSGDIDAEEKATLQFQTPGKLIWVGVKEGDYVNKFQAIASLDQRDLKKQLQKDLNSYSKERLKFDQQQDDIRPVVIGALSKDQQTRLLRTAQQSQFDLNNTVLDVEISDISLQLANIYSPISGVVTKVTTPNAGVNVQVKDALFEVVNPDTIYFAATADQTEVVKLEEGMMSEIVLDSFPDEQFSGEVISVAFSPEEEETGTVYKVKMVIDQNASDSSKLRLGMTGDATFTLKERVNIIAIPTTYIKYENNKPYVLTNAKKRSEKTFITTGEEIDIATIVTSGLKAGDVIYD